MSFILEIIACESVYLFLLPDLYIDPVRDKYG